MHLESPIDSDSQDLTKLKSITSHITHHTKHIAYYKIFMIIMIVTFQTKPWSSYENHDLNNTDTSVKQIIIYNKYWKMKSNFTNKLGFAKEKFKVLNILCSLKEKNAHTSRQVFFHNCLFFSVFFLYFTYLYSLLKKKPIAWIFSKWPIQLMGNWKNNAFVCKSRKKCV